MSADLRNGLGLRARELKGQGGEDLVRDAPIAHARPARQFAKLGAGHHQRHLARQQLIQRQANAGGGIGLQIFGRPGPMQGGQRLREGRELAQRHGAALVPLGQGGQTR